MFSVISSTNSPQTFSKTGLSTFTDEHLSYNNILSISNPAGPTDRQKP